MTMAPSTTRPTPTAPAAHSSPPTAGLVPPTPPSPPSTGVESAAAALERLRRARSRVPVWSARLVFVLGLLMVAAAALPHQRRWIDWPVDLLPPMGIAAVSVLGIAVGLGLVIMARGLRRRKRQAARSAVALLSVGILVHLLRGIDPVQSVISAAVVAVLLTSRAEFVGRPDPRSRRSVPIVMAAALGTCWVLGCLLTVADRDGLARGWTTSQVLLQSLSGLIGIAGPVRFITPGLADRNSVELLGLGIIAAVITLTALLASSATREGSNRLDRTRVRALLEHAGENDSLGYFALRDDKSYTFSPSGKAAVAYRVVGGVCLAAADPIGDREAWPGAIEAWLTKTQQHAWVPAVLAPSEKGAGIYRRVGLDALEIGDEAILEVDDFTLEGRSMRSVRQAVARARRAGQHTVITYADDLTSQHRAALRERTATWPGREGAERGFSMALSRFGAAEDNHCVVVEGRGPDHELVGLLQLVPWGTHGWSLDLMLHRPGEGAGVMELMITDLVKYARQSGISRISLNFALFRSAFARAERVGAGPVLRLWVRLLLFASRWFQIESLYRSNAKLRPTWEPRFICFAEARDLAPIIVAALRAEGLLTLPHLPHLPHRPGKPRRKTAQEGR